MAETLFPVFDVPEINIPNPAEEQKYRQSIFFDYDAGDFRLNGGHDMTLATGREAYMQWCMAAVRTERSSCLAYNSDFGVEMEAAVAMPSEAAQRSAIERTIREALMVNPKTEYVNNFTFQTGPGWLQCHFDVKGKGWEEIPLSLPIKGA